MNIAALRELWEKTTPGRWKCEGGNDGHRIRMGTALKSPYSFEPQHVCEYEHGLLPRDGRQYREARANAQFFAAAHNEMGKLLDVVEAADRVVRTVLTTGASCMDDIRALNAALAKLEG